MKLDQLAALGANHVVVLRVPVIVLVNFAAVGASDFTEQPGLLHQIERAVNGRPADSLAVRAISKPGDDFVRIKVLVIGEHFVDDDLPLTSRPQILRQQKFSKLLDRREIGIVGKLTEVAHAALRWQVASFELQNLKITRQHGLYTNQAEGHLLWPFAAERTEPRPLHQSKRFCGACRIGRRL